MKLHSVILGVLIVFLGAAPAQAQEPRVVTLVGSLQSELGCPGDWQPECPRPGCCPSPARPASSAPRSRCRPAIYEYKVALNGSWDENYGAGGAPGGANIPLTAPGGQITFTYDHATHGITDDAPGPGRRAGRPLAPRAD